MAYSPAYETTPSHPRERSSHRGGSAARVAVLFVTAALACVLAACGFAPALGEAAFGPATARGPLLAGPTQAYAAPLDGELDKADPNVTALFEGDVSQQDVFARVTDEGALRVSESSTVDFEKPVLCFRADIGGLPSETVYEVESVTVGTDPASQGSDSASQDAADATTASADAASASASAESAASDFIQLPEVPFDVQWREATVEDCPDRPCWSFDAVRNHVYVFGNFADIQRITVNYTARFSVQRYADSSELFWHVKGAGDYAVSNLNVDVTLPVPQDAPRIELGVNSYAWLHGPAGSQAKRISNDCVEYLFPEVAKDQFAEVRLLFPAQWLDGADREAANVHRDIWHRDQALRDEHEWSNGMRRWAMNDAGRTAVALGFGCVVLGWGLVSFVRFLRRKDAGGEAPAASAASDARTASTASDASAASATPDAPAASAAPVSYWQARKFGLVGMAGLFLALALVCGFLVGSWTVLQVTVGALALLFVLAQFVRRS